MRIVYVYAALATRGGVERILADKMNHLAAIDGYEVSLITYNQGQHPVSFPLDTRVQHIDLRVSTHQQYRYRGLHRQWKAFQLNRLLYRRMKEQLANLVPDIIVTTTAGEFSLLLKVKGSTPLLVESHGGYDHLIDYPQMTWWHRWDIRRRYRQLHRAAAIVTLTERDAERWRKHYSQVHMIPNMVHLNPTDRYVTGEQQRVIFVGRLAEQKGIPELVAVWRKVFAKHPDWSLEVFGDGSLASLLQQEEGVHLHASVDDIFSQYVKASLLIVTSRWEPFGLVIPEAMSCGLPVVSFEGDGPCDIITDGKDGFLVKGRSVEDFADRVCQLIENQTLRRQMGQTAIQSAQRYAAEKILPQWKQLFEVFVKR